MLNILFTSNIKYKRVEFGLRFTCFLSHGYTSIDNTHVKFLIHKLKEGNKIERLEFF
jgi:hypothetical protein